MTKQMMQLWHHCWNILPAWRINWVKNESVMMHSLSKHNSAAMGKMMMWHRNRAQHESIHGSPVLEPVGLVNMQGPHLDPNGVRCWITWPVDDYLQVTCVYLHMPKPPQWPYAPARKWHTYLINNPQRYLTYMHPQIPSAEPVPSWGRVVHHHIWHGTRSCHWHAEPCKPIS